jgi:hypothetical protein
VAEDTPQSRSPVWQERPRRYRDAAVDVAAAAFLPVVAFLVPFHAVAVANVNDLLYHPTVAGALLAAGLTAWLGGTLLVRRYDGAIVARLWMSLPWAVLLLDVAGPAVEKHEVGPWLALAVDAAIVLAVVAGAVAAPWRGLRAVAAAAGLTLLVHDGGAHAAFVRGLQPDLLVGAGTARLTTGWAAPASGPGNVYHLLFDAYHSEAFPYSVGEAAPRRFPGFTYFTRFNSNFPHTSSAEPALIHGRVPQAGMSIEQWPDVAMRDGLWADLTRHDVGVWLYPYGRWLCYQAAVNCLTSMDLERDAGATTTRDALVDLWFLRLLPASIERRLSAAGDGERGRFSVTSTARTLMHGRPVSPQARTESGDLPTQYFNLKQFDALLADESARPARGQYVYYHALIPHHDYMLNAQCDLVAEPRYAPAEYWAFVDCANLMIERLVDRLRQLGRLDESLIVVHADHGDPNFLVAPDEWMPRDPRLALDPIARTYQPADDTYRTRFTTDIMEGDSAAWRSIAVEQLSSALLLVKLPNARTYAEDTSPVQLLDIAPTVLAHFGAPAAAYSGLALSRVPRDRRQTFFAHSRTFDGKISRYVLGPDGWRFVDDIAVKN